jgi:TatD DNase family protein
MYIDGHAHLHLYEDEEMEAVLGSITDLGILMLSVSVDVESFLRTEAIAARCDLVVPAFGVHPWAAPEAVEGLDALEPHFDRSPVIGEIGLDHRFVTDEALYELQRDVFDWLLARTVAQDKLASIHCVGAEQETLDLIAAHGLERGIVHWYSGPLDVLERMIAYGLRFSVGVEILRSDHIRAIARAIPDGLLLTETDNPGGPREVTGELGFPPLVVEVVEELARVRGTTPDGILEMVRRNWASLVQNDRHLEPWASHLRG